MVLPRSQPWLLSLGLHLLMGGLVVALFVTSIPSPPAVIRMRLVQAGASATPVAPPSEAWWSGAKALVAAESEPALPSWQASSAVPAPEVTRPSVPVSLDELLAADSNEVPEPTSSGGWTSADGEGYAPPPLPPPSLAPPEGSRWSLVLTIPAGGGFATGLEGLDSGHPDLDRWLEEYLRTVAFPSSPDSSSYQLRWSLRLDSGRPR